MLFKNKPVLRDVLCDWDGYRISRGGSVIETKEITLTLLEQLKKSKEDEQLKQKVILKFPL